jgi:small subunit ribosomal protein S8
MINDPIADMIIRIKNANQTKAATVMVPHSQVKEEICRILHTTGFIAEYQVQDIENHKNLRVFLKYNGSTKDRVITDFKRISKCGRRFYVGADAIPKVLRGMGVVIMSTSKGIMTGHEAAKLHQGGEVIAYVW